MFTLPLLFSPLFSANMLRSISRSTRTLHPSTSTLANRTSPTAITRSVAKCSPNQQRCAFSPSVTYSHNLRFFSSSIRLGKPELKPYLLADVGEGITECEIIKWWVTRRAGNFLIMSQRLVHAQRSLAILNEKVARYMKSSVIHI